MSITSDHTPGPRAGGHRPNPSLGSEFDRARHLLILAAREHLGQTPLPQEWSDETHGTCFAGPYLLRRLPNGDWELQLTAQRRDDNGHTPTVVRSTYRHAITEALRLDHDMKMAAVVHRFYQDLRQLGVEESARRDEERF